uniref:Uncharacterized protein n=1 Tax=Arcella intermedia TaxID=1963864 RepID=A0A6B2L2Q0_9EUKA
MCDLVYNCQDKIVLHRLQNFTQEQIINGRNSRGQSLLYCAAAGGSLSLTKKFIAMGLPLSTPQGPKLSTPLHAASWKGNTEVVSLLLLSKADIDAKNEMGLKPIYEAQSTSKFAWELFEAEGLSGIKRLIPKPNTRFHLILKSMEELPIKKNSGDPVIPIAVEFTISEMTAVQLVTPLPPAPLARIRVAQTVQGGSWEWAPPSKGGERKKGWVVPIGGETKAKLGLDILDIEKIKVNIRCIQTVETGIGGAKEDKVIGEGDFEVNVDNTMEYKKSTSLALKAENNKAKINFLLTVLPLNSHRMKKAMDKVFASEEALSEKQFVEFYGKMRKSLTEWKTAQYSMSKTGVIKSSLKKKMAHLKEEEKADVNNVTGIFFPQMTIESFGRNWDVLEINTKYKHVLGHLLYIPVLISYARMQNLTFREFVDKRLLNTNFIPILERMGAKDNLSMNFFSLLLCKYLDKH